MNEKELIQRIYKLLKIPNPPLKENNLSKQVIEALTVLEKQVNEMYDCATDISNGHLQKKYSRSNMLLGPLKDLLTSLHYFTWSIEEVTNGNYEQSIDFLDEYSDSFNKMIYQLKTNEELRKQNELLQQQMHKKEVEILQEQLKAQMNYHSKLLEKDKKLREFRHDIQNHVLTLYSLLDSNNIEDAKKYLDDTFAIVTKSTLTIHTGNPIFDFLLSEKLSTANQIGAKIQTNINIIDKMRVSDIDWSILLGNIFDNAIEAWKKIEKEEDRIGTFNFFANDNMISFELNNTTAAPLKMENGEIVTTKSDKQNHGIGLNNVRRCIRKYNGEIQIKYQDGIFHLFFVIFH